MDLDVVKIIQSLRNPVLDWLFYFITHFGDKYVFIGAAVIIYWTINKRYAHRFVFAFMISALVNSSLKQIFQRLRPYYYPGVTYETRWLTPGYAFPSGHSQAAGVLGYTLYDVSKRKNKKWILYLGIAIMVLVPFSRVYLGQHYLSDVVVGVLLSFVLVHFLFKLIDKMGDHEHVYTLMLAPIAMLTLFFVQNAVLFISVGGFVGFAVGYYFEKEKVKYDVSAVLWVQVLKVVFGLIVFLAIKEGLKVVFPYSLNEATDPTILDLFFDFTRYLMIGAWAALGAPLVFKYVTKYYKKNI